MSAGGSIMIASCGGILWASASFRPGSEPVCEFLGALLRGGKSCQTVVCTHPFSNQDVCVGFLGSLHNCGICEDISPVTHAMPVGVKRQLRVDKLDGRGRHAHDRGVRQQAAFVKCSGSVLTPTTHPHSVPHFLQPTQRAEIDSSSGLLLQRNFCACCQKSSFPHYCNWAEFGCQCPPSLP